MDDDMDMDDMPEGMEMGDMPTDGPLFWSMKVEANKTVDIDQPAIPNYIVHITNACFGPTVSNKSRSVVMVSTITEDDDEDSDGFPLCVLRQGECENQSLDLLFNESASLTVKGKNASTVYLTGYIQPPVSGGDDLGQMDPAMMEDMDEQQIMETLRQQKLQQRSLDDEDDDDEDKDSDDEDDEEIDEPPTKKQKTAKGQKATANGSKADKDKKRKNAKGSDADEEEEVKPKKGKKGMKKMGGGIQFKDMSTGKGKECKKGDKLRVYYVGQTQDKEVFDKAITGSGFEFTLGKGEVIKGWDMGCKGMKVGGKRKLIIPSKLAYGTEGSPPTIPPNADLTFTIMLKAINGQS